LAYFAKIALATATLTAGGLIAIRLVAVGVHALRDDPVPPADPVAEVQPQAPVVEPEPAPLDPPPPAVDVRGAAEPPPTRTRNMRAPTSEADIAAELELLRRARAASSPAAVIDILDEHARRFPSGSLADERDALWSISSCEAGQVAEARTRALDLARRRPHSPLLERLAKRCPAIATDLRAAIEQ
jgi:hypothetical protein